MAEQLKNHLETLVEALDDNGYEPEVFKNGLCAVLTLALFRYATLSLCLSNVDITVLYRIERDNDDDKELDRVVSHVMFGFEDDTLDIEGWEADDRWNIHIDENLNPYNDNAYNDTEYQIFKADDSLEVFFDICENYAMSLEDIDKIINIFENQMDAP
jgi:hypothetical protein